MRRKSLGGLASFVVLLGAGLFILTGHSTVSKAQMPASTASATAMPAPADKASAELSDADIQQAMTLHTMGKADAPLKMVEFASLSCPHCAEFFKETFPLIKKNYIDTGKIQYTYVDFPLNAPALNAAAAALCMPAETYFRYLDYLFETQDQWVFSDKQNTTLVQNAKLLGADGDKLERCMASKKLKEAIVDRMKLEGQAFGVEATPTFIFDNDKKKSVPGALPYPDFAKIIDKALAEHKSAAPAAK
jgi:protein-disulfide isomerase